jgi:hypothetical protein
LMCGWIHLAPLKRAPTAQVGQTDLLSASSTCPLNVPFMFVECSLNGRWMCSTGGAKGEKGTSVQAFRVRAALC